MPIQFSGLGSGLPIQEWIDATIRNESTRLYRYKEDKNEAQNAKSALSSVESKFSSLRFAIENLTDANLAKTLDLFEKRTVSTSDDTVATATAESGSAMQQIKLEIERLATATTAQSITEVGQLIDGSEKFLDLSSASLKGGEEGEEGTFSIYVDGVKHEFTINETDTLSDIVDNINNEGIAGLQASIENGNFQLKIDNDNIGELTLGSSSDSSNFFNVMNLSTATAANISDAPYDQVYASVDTVSKVDEEGAILNGDANLSGSFTEESYTFKIGDAEFTVEGDLTLQGLISRINNDDDSNVVISYDARENKFNLISTEPGSTAINLEDTSGDFLQQIGLITAGGDSLSSQTLGENARVYVNGSTEALEVNSNTITSDISGIIGVTISLKDITEAGETINLNIEQDTDKLTSAVENFIKSFNSAIDAVDKETSSGNDLYGEYSLVSIRNNLRSMVTDMASGLSDYNSFGMIGISTGDVGTSVEEETNTLEFDKDEFLAALKNNPSEVKALLVGDSDLGITGILQDLESVVEGTLDPVNGYFESREDSLNTTIANLDNILENEEERLEKRRDQLTLKYNQMDQYISELQSQQSALSLL